jgi:hypothetical protein
MHRLLEEIEDHILQDFADIATLENLQLLFEDPPEYLDRIFATIDSNYDFYARFLTSHYGYRLISKIAYEIKWQMIAIAEQATGLDSVNLDVLFTYAASGMVALFHEFFAQKFSLSKKEFLLQMQKVVTNSMNGYLIDQGSVQALSASTLTSTSSYR